MLMIMLLSALNLWAFFRGRFKPIKNTWALIFLFYLISLHIILAPAIGIIIVDCPIVNPWLWKPLFMILLSAISIFAISSIDFIYEEEKLLLRIMLWVGFIMALYVVLQFMGLDQFFTVANPQHYSLPSNPTIGGTLGHPTTVGAFMAMIIPIALYFKKYISALIIICAVLLTKSHVAIGAMIVSVLFFYTIRNKTAFYLFIGLFLITGLFCGLNKQCKQEFSRYSSGRVTAWQYILQDLKTPLNKDSKNLYPITGIGLGSFKYIFHLRHPTTKDKFKEAHNEYLELMNDIGIAGAILFLCAIWELLRHNFSFVNRYRQMLLSSFICISICAGGNFVWHLAPTALYTIFIVGLLNNYNQRGEIC